MIASRVWVLLLVLLGVAGIGTALLTKGVVQRQYDTELADSLRRDRFEVELILKLDARTRLDDLARVAAHEDVRAALRSLPPRRDEASLRDVNMRLKSKLLEINRQLEGASGDLLFALDGDGTVIAQLGPNEARYGGSLATFPLVSRALAGFVRDDVWFYDGRAYRMAARPVIDAGQFVGAVVLGKKLDEKFAELIATRLDGATVAFFQGPELIASHTPAGIAGAPTGPDIGANLAAIAADAGLAEGRVAGPIGLRDRGMAVFSLSVGQAREAKVGYAIARKRPTVANAAELFALITKDDLAAANVPMLGVGGLLLFAMAMLLFGFEHDMPLSKFKKDAAALGARTIDRLVAADFRGAYRRISIDVNHALDKVAETAKPSGTNLDALLGPPPDATQPQNAFFAFGEVPESPKSAAPPAAGDTLASIPPQTRTLPPATSGRPKAPPLPVPARSSGVASSPAAAAFFQANDGGDDAPAALEEERTMAIHNPEDYDITARQSLPSVADATESMPAIVDVMDEASHFRATYEEYIAIKERCGEPTAGLTFERFEQTLKSRKTEILAQHEAHDVRFSVYEKDGKAKLKATPIK
jgi:hypothetical protein